MLFLQECEWYKIKIRIPRKTILWLKDNFYIMKETKFLKARPIFCYLCQLLDWLSAGCFYNSVLWFIYSFKFNKVWFLIFIMSFFSAKSMSANTPHYFYETDALPTALRRQLPHYFYIQTLHTSKFSNFKAIIWESSKEPVSKSETDFTIRMLKLQLSYYDNNDQNYNVIKCLLRSLHMPKTKQNKNPTQQRQTCSTFSTFCKIFSPQNPIW